MIRRPHSLRFSLLAVAACATLLGLSACGGSSQTSSAALKFPGLGYHYYPPHLPKGLAKNAVVVVDLTNSGRVAPAAMRFASDATLSGARWTAWGSDSTTGHGTATVRICSPNCGAGHFSRYPATMVLKGVRTCGAHRYYESARVTLTTVKGPVAWGAFVKVPCS
ncbi:MAG: hypothetical protein WAK93_00360 [Solirubrobacteraceae bacterium]